MVKNKKIDGQEELKKLTKEVGILAKKHTHAKHLLSNAQMELALLKAIMKHEKQTKTRPEEIYIEKIKTQLNKAIIELRGFYEKPKSVVKNKDIQVTEDSSITDIVV